MKLAEERNTHLPQTKHTVFNATDKRTIVFNDNWNNTHCTQLT